MRLFVVILLSFVVLLLLQVSLVEAVVIPCPEGQYQDLSSEPAVCRPLLFPEWGFQRDEFEANVGTAKITSECNQTSLVEALSSVGSQGGGIVTIPACTFTVTRMITVPGNTILQGQGAGKTVLIARYDQVIMVRDVENVIVRDITIDGENHVDSRRHFRIQRASNVLFEGLEATGSDESAGMGYNDSHYVTVRYSESHHNGRHGINNSDDKDPNVSDTVSIYSNHFHSNALTSGFGGYGIDLGTTGGEVAGNLVENNKYGTKFPAAQNLYIHHNMIRNNHNTGARTYEYSDGTRAPINMSFCYNKILNNAGIALAIQDSTNTLAAFNEYVSNNPNSISNKSQISTCAGAPELEMPVSYEGTAWNMASQSVCDFCKASHRTTVKPTVTPTKKPTASPTAKPTPSSTPTPTPTRVSFSELLQGFGKSVGVFEFNEWVEGRN